MDDATAKELQAIIDTIDLELGVEAIEDDDPRAYVTLLQRLAIPTAAEQLRAAEKVAEARERLDNDPAERQRIRELGDSLNTDD